MVWEDSVTFRGEAYGAVHIMMEEERKQREGELWYWASIPLSPPFSAQCPQPTVPPMSRVDAPSVNILWRNRHTLPSHESRGRVNQAAPAFTHSRGYAPFHHSVQLPKLRPHLPALLLSSNCGRSVSSRKMPHAEDQGTTFTTP